MVAPLSDIDEIRRHMAQIRHELHEDVQGVVKGAEAATDWRRYVRSYPWVAVGLAFGVGYLLVPKRHRALTGPVVNLAALDHVRPAVQEVAKAVEPVKKKGKGLLKGAIGLVAPFALRAAQGYALQFFEQYLAQKMAQQHGSLADLAASFMNQGGPDGGMQAPPQSAARPTA